MPPGCRRSRTTPISAIVSRDATNPPTFTTPLARPIDSCGVNERARSKPTIEAGPPAAVVQTSTTSSHIGAGVSRSSTAVHGTTMIPTTPITMNDR